MLKKRIIPCLDIQNGRTVKGVNFVNIKDAGEPVQLAEAYVKQGADELVFLDITATIEGRKTFAELVKKIAATINIPFTVGGGISELRDVEMMLEAGADKISINSAAVKKPMLIEKLAKEFGSQCVVLAIDTNIVENEWKVFVHGGRTSTELNIFDWAKQAENYGAGEILLTSMANDGTKKGFATELTKGLTSIINLPVIASGGAGNMKHFEDVFKIGNADAALAASIFHFGEVSIPELKNHLKNKNIPVR